MRVLVNTRCIRPRLLRLRSVRGWSGNFSHVHNHSFRPNYEFDPDRITKVKICRDSRLKPIKSFTLYY